MNKEDILEKSRKENQNKDIVELEAINTSSRIAVRIGMFFCCVAVLLEFIFTEHINYGIWMIYFSILASTFLIKYIKLRRRHELFVTILYTALFIAFLVFFILDLAGVLK